MRIERRHLHYTTTADTDIIDLTEDLERFVRQAAIQDGLLLVFVPGSTAAITTLEFESGAIADLQRAIEALAPREAEYQHNLRWHDGNGYSHVRAALLGPSITLPIVEGEIVHGTWQQPILCDFDNRPRRRRVHLQVMGE